MKTKFFSNVVFLIFFTLMLFNFTACVETRYQSQSHSSGNDHGSSNSASTGSGKKFFYFGEKRILFLIPIETLDLYPIYEQYPRLTHISVGGRHGAGRYSLEALEDNNFVIDVPEPGEMGKYIVSVTIPNNNSGYDEIQFMYEN